jgi:prepilin-type N-terminal cleavage/methylation domain-containing protein
MTFPHRIRRQDGFTLLEVCAVILILAILAGITYAVFMGQDRSALDAEAKSNARSLLWKVHSCFTAKEDYTLCDEPTEQEPPPGVTWGPAPGEVEVVRGPDTTRYRVTVRALSEAKTDGAYHSFTIVKELEKPDQRLCEPAHGGHGGGCHGGTW